MERTDQSAGQQMERASQLAGQQMERASQLAGKQMGRTNQLAGQQTGPIQGPLQTDQPDTDDTSEREEVAAAQNILDVTACGVKRRSEKRRLQQQRRRRKKGRRGTQRREHLKIAFLNIQGGRQERKWLEMTEVLHSEKLAAFMVVETHLRDDETPPTINGFAWEGLNRVGGERRGGGIGFLGSTARPWRRFKQNCSEHMWIETTLNKRKLAIAGVYWWTGAQEEKNITMAKCLERDIEDLKKTHVSFEHFSQTIKKDGQRYDVTLPWKRDPVGFLEDNYTVSLTRLKKLVARLKRTEGLLLRYDGVIREYFNLGHAEVVDTDAESKGPVYYMPHSAVIREDRATTKVRVVFDASSHAPQCPSLNECLDKGVNLNPDILQLLIRFRSFKIALTADIEKAFLQVQVREKDRDVFRYIWFEQQPDCGKYVGDSEGLQTLRMTRVPFGATSSPFLLSATIQHHLNGIDGNLKATAEKLRKSFYVDDLVTGVDSEEEARKLYEDSMLIMKAAGMNLRKWTSNSVNLQVMFDGGLSCEATSSVSEILSPQQILGVSWDKARDFLQVSLKSLFTFLLETGDTKRFVLQASSRVFDPLGFMSPFTIRVKRLFQQLWIDGVDWDAKLPDQAQLEWKAWCTELPTLRLVSVCRHVGIYASNGARHVTLYAFSDASIHAYGAVVYACAKSQEPHSDVNLLVSKSRVAPVKELTLPRLELMGALVATRLVNYVRTALEDCVVECHYWTDSTIVLAWIRHHPSRWNPFVAHRVSEIRTLSDPDMWKHCVGEDNPADLITRGISAHRLVEEDLWWHGPKWLKDDPSEWPNANGFNDTDVELRKSSAGKQNELVLQVTSQSVEAIIDVQRFSSLDRLLRVTAYVLRFTSNCRNLNQKLEGPLSTNELHEAKFYWVRVVQHEVYDLKKGKNN
ncbi:uncharacterized protein LOC135389629 [Ornithodoros turicata]|uniref:uncharacterized protein LOC135389629 n=1 Tax=Ornithodoros turicata TaxID=34597 RepID=UPI003139D13E